MTDKPTLEITNCFPLMFSLDFLTISMTRKLGVEANLQYIRKHPEKFRFIASGKAAEDSSHACVKDGKVELEKCPECSMLICKTCKCHGWSITP